MMTNKRWIMAVLAMLVLPAMACSFSFDLAGETPGPPTATPLGPGPAGPSFSNVFFAAGVTASNEPVDVATDFPQGATMVYAFASYGGMADGAQCQSLWYLGGEEAARTDFEWNMGESGTTWIANLENEDGLQSGRYEWELLVEGELVASGGFGIAAPTGVLFEDDFTDVGSGWEVGDYDGAGVGYKNGIYFVISVGDGKNMWGVANRSFSDLAIEVDATQVSAPASNDNAYGIACRVQPNGDGYYLFISGDGFSSIVRVVEDEFEPLLDWVASDAILEGNATNELRAVCDGPNLSLFANGELVAETSDSTFSDGDLALAGTSFELEPTEIHFDNLVVLQP